METSLPFRPYRRYRPRSNVRRAFAFGVSDASRFASIVRPNRHFNAFRRRFVSPFSLKVIMQSSVPSQSSVAETSELMQFARFIPDAERQAFNNAVEKLEKKNRRLTALAEFLHEAVGQLRFDAHYLIFDLEATRRERDELRRRDD